MNGQNDPWMRPAMLRERFARLLNGFSALGVPKDTSPTPSTARLRTLLERFVDLRKLSDASERIHAADDHKRIRALLAGYNETVERYREQQVQVADDFNLLEVMQLTGKEIRHSMVLAWLLDHDFRKLGTHAQGNLGFRLFLSEFSLPIDYAACKYWVRREVAGDKSIVDIEVACRGRFVIHIENKIWSVEGEDQTEREWSDLQRRAKDLNVTEPDSVHAFFLTPDGRKAANSHFQEISWRRVARVFEDFAVQARPPDVKVFAAHYAGVLRRFIVPQSSNEDADDERTLERS